jgi:hypothetical protein
MHKRFVRRGLLVVIGLVIALCGLPNLGMAATPHDGPFYWESINADINVQPNGDMLVTETQTYMFTRPHTNQRYRYIPLSKVDDIKDVSVQEDNRIIPSQTGIENNQFWIRWQHDLRPPERHVFVLKYRVIGGLHVDSQNTQVYWKAIFADRQAPVQMAKVRVELPMAVSGKVQSFKKFGATATASQVDGRTFEFLAQQPIPPQQELEVNITFPSQILNLPVPNWQDSTQGTNLFTSMLGYAILLVPVGIVLVTFIKFLTDNSTGGGGSGDGGSDYTPSSGG